MLSPGTRVMSNGTIGTIEKKVGPGEYIVRLSGGRRVARHERTLTSLERSSVGPAELQEDDVQVEDPEEEQAD